MQNIKWVGDTMEIKNNKDNSILEEYIEIAQETTTELYYKYKTKKEGLSSKEAKKRLEEDGLNIVVKKKI